MVGINPAVTVPESDVCVSGMFLQCAAYFGAAEDKLQAKHPGRVHFDMEKPGRPSRWNTLRALRVLDYFDN